MSTTLDRLASKSVTVVGDVMLDEYVWGDVDRISPEAPVPVVRVRERTRIPGGAANAAAGVAALGAHASLVGVLGDDEAGRALRVQVEHRGIDASHLIAAGGRATTTKTRVIAHNQQVVRADVEDAALPGKSLEDALIGAVGAALADAQSLIVSDYGKGVISTRVAQEAIAAAAGRGCPVVVDPKGGDYSKYRGATVITPNVHELELGTRVQITGDESLEEAAGLLRGQLGGTAILVTRGAAGMSLFGERRVDVPAVAQAVYDVTGAGDTVVAVLATALAAGVELEEAAQLANRAAGIAVGKVGTAAVELRELAAVL